MISVVLPSRERPQLAKEAIESFGGHKGFEFIVAIDDDDTSDYSEVKKIAKVLVMPRAGYRHLEKYMNAMAKVSKGDWIMNFNDDAKLESSPEDLYDTVDEFAHTQPIVLNPWKELDNLFPIISRKFYEIVGHFSLNTHVDSWVQEVSEHTGTQYYIPGIKINHFRDTLSDTTHEDSQRTAFESSAEYSSEPMVALRQVDINKIKEWIDEDNN